MRIPTSLLAVLLFAHPVFATAPVDTVSASNQPKAISSPIDAPKSICLPSFQLATGPNDADTAFILENPTKSAEKLLLTAHHLFGPDGGIEPQISWSALPSAVSGVKCESLLQPSWQLSAGQPFAIKNAKSYAEEGPRKDLAIFPLKKAPQTGLKLASTNPKVDDVVWLVARARSGAAPTVLLHKARVLSSDQNELVYAYENSALGLAGSSGAPVVNELGEVVGVNFGGGKNQIGERLGFATGRNVIANTLAEIK